MIKSEFIDLLAEKLQLKQKDTELAVNEILGFIHGTLEKGGRVEVRDFGVFSLHYHAARVGRNPLSGEKVQVPAKHVVHFKPGKGLRQRVNSPDKPPIADD